MKSKHRLNRMELREERAAYGFLFISLIGTVTFILVPIIMSFHWIPGRKSQKHGHNDRYQNKSNGSY